MFKKDWLAHLIYPILALIAILAGLLFPVFAWLRRVF